MDSTRVARLIVAVRQEKRWRQVDLARLARVSQTMVSRAERGRIEGMTVGALERIARALEIDLRLDAWWRGGQGDRLVDRGHAALVEMVVGTLKRHGWETVVEYTFNHYGDRGAVDVLAFHMATRVLLIVEVKTRFTDLQAFLASFGRKMRVVPDLVRSDLGWDSAAAGQVVVAPGTTANRAVVARHPSIFATSFPGRAAQVRRWIRSPDGPIAAIWFVDLRRSSGSLPARRVRPSTSA